jgi:putative photosynthetic complex assembly protein
MSDAAIKLPPPGMPKQVLLAAAALIALTLVGATTARLTGIGKTPMPVVSPVQSLSLRFDDQQNGSVLVRRASDRAVIYTIAPETNGFMRATLRGLAQERRRSGIDDTTPFLLTRWSDGGMSLDDPTTGRDVALEAFGETNAGAFARLFVSGEQK